MKNLHLLLIALLVLCGCKKENQNQAYSETLVTGSKWGLKIGSPATDVYSQIRALGNEKHFDYVEVVKPVYTSPVELQNVIPYYDQMLIQGSNETVAIYFTGDKVVNINTGNKSVTKWPQTVADASAILKDDAVTSIFTKLTELYKQAAYQGYNIYLFSKPLAKPFDPDMVNHQWVFVFSTELGNGKQGQSSVKLIFEGGKLRAIKHEYRVNMVYYDF